VEGRETSKAERKGYKRADLHLSIFLIQQKVLEKGREGGKMERYFFLLNDLTRGMRSGKEKNQTLREIYFTRYKTYWYTDYND